MLVGAGDGASGLANRAVAACVPSTEGIAAANRRPKDRKSQFVPPGYRPVWNDEFADLDLGDSFPTNARWVAHFGKWNVRILGANGDEAVKVADSTLLKDGRTVAEAMRRAIPASGSGRFIHCLSNLTLKLRTYPIPKALQWEFWGFPYAGAMISGEPSFAQRYGYWEVRLRLDSIGPSQHFALWLLPRDGGWPPEIDIIEVVGSKSHEFLANTHAPKGVVPPPMTFYREPATADGFHVFGLQLTPKVTRWTVDGHLVRETPDLTGGKALYLIASWEVEHGWPGEADASTPWPAEVAIDYVRIYAPRDAGH
jgi:hypothetical protein